MSFIFDSDLTSDYTSTHKKQQSRALDNLCVNIVLHLVSS